MNIYQKLTQARLDLQNLKLKMSGFNKFSNYAYYELSDILPAINMLCQKHNLMTNFSIIKNEVGEKALLTITNSEEPSETTSFIAPTAEVEIGKKKDGTGGAEPIQNLGGKITYMRRYLFLMAFEIIESDSVDRINKDLTNEVNEEDQAKIDLAKTVAELEALYKELSGVYKIKLLVPLFKTAKEKLAQAESEA